jgi:hypothetical protein
MDILIPWEVSGHEDTHVPGNIPAG